MSRANRALTLRLEDVQVKPLAKLDYIMFTTCKRIYNQTIV